MENTPSESPECLWLESPAAREWAIAQFRHSPPQFRSQEYVALKEKLDTRIAQLKEAQGSGNDNLIAELEGEVGRLRVLLAPIHRIPVEILRIIIGSTGQAEYPNEPGLALVSKVWREIALATPCIWSKVNVSDVEYPSDRLTEWLSRSKEEPLSVNLHLTDMGLRSEDTCLLLWPHLPRLASLEPHGGTDALGCFCNRLRSDLLRRIVIAPSPPNTDRTPCYSLSPPQMILLPELQYLEIRDWWISFMNMRQFLMMLPEAKSLGSLELIHVKWTHAFDVSDTVLELKLWKLDFRTVHRQTVSLPEMLIMNSRNLKELTFGEIYTRFHPPITSESHPSMESVVFLVGTPYNAAMDDIKTSRRLDWVFKMTNLNHLTLMWCGPLMVSNTHPETARMMDIRQVIPRMTSPEDGEYLLPKLESLTLARWMVDVNQLRDFLRTRLSVQLGQDNGNTATSRNCTISLRHCPVSETQIIPYAEKLSFQELAEGPPKLSFHELAEWPPVGLSPTDEIEDIITDGDS